MAAGAPAISADRLVKQFGTGDHAVIALNDVSLTINDNEFFTLLGPSGCGKTTLLRLVAGFEQPTRGSVSIFGEAVAGLPPFERPVNTVFQHYALFPHMTVAENVGFGLRMQGRDANEIDSAIATSLDLVKMQDFATRKPNQLSGGQQQRIALARALAPRPKVLLLDEPLSALDLKLRQAMRSELKTLQRETGITFVFVTHDQEEALTMSDRIAVMSEGEVQQIGTPHEIYEQPDNRFVADFIGDSNFLEVSVERIDGNTAHVSAGGSLTIATPAISGVGTGDAATLAIRPEKIRLSPDGSWRVADSMYLGTDTSYRVTDGTNELTVREQNAESGTARFSAGDNVTVDIVAGSARILRS